LFNDDLRLSKHCVFSRAGPAMSSQDVAVFFVDVGMFLALISIFFGAAFYVIYKIGDLVVKKQTTRNRAEWPRWAQTLAGPQRWFDLEVSKLRVLHPRCHSGVKWAVPVFMVSLGQFAMQVMLHCATYFYILTMDTYSHEVRSVSTPGNFTSHLSMGWGANASKPLGSLEDPVAAMVSFNHVSLSVLDMVAGALMAAFVVLCFLQGDKKLWTKVLLCHALLAFCKGVIDVTTVEPDSSGWVNCQHRLGGAIVIAEFKKLLPNPFVDGYAWFFFKVAQFEMFGFHTNHITSGVRYCSDMMLSGHTFVTCLYALGNCELMHRIRQNRKCPGPIGQATGQATGQVIYLFFVGLIICEQCLEIYLILSDRFHYTADVVVAIMAALVLYTNGPLAIYAEWWASSFGEFAPDESEGNIWVPACCVPFCDPHGDCLGMANGYHKLKWVAQEQEVWNWKAEEERVAKFGWKIEQFKFEKGNDTAHDLQWQGELLTGCIVDVRTQTLEGNYHENVILFEYLVIYWKFGDTGEESDESTALWMPGPSASQMTSGADSVKLYPNVAGRRRVLQEMRGDSTEARKPQDLQEELKNLKKKVDKTKDLYPGFQSKRRIRHLKSKIQAHIDKS